MDFGAGSIFKPDELLFLGATSAVAAVSSFAVFVACYAWFRFEQRRAQRRLFHVMNQGKSGGDEFFLTGRDVSACGELVAQFRVNHGKQVVSVLESSEGRRFVHIDGDLSAPQRARMIRYLKSEGFMS